MKFQEHPARQWIRKASTVTVLLLSFIIAACETTGGGSFGGSAESRAQQLVLNGEYQEAAGVYIGLAAEASGSERDRLTLLAADSWLDAGEKRISRRRAAAGRRTSLALEFDPGRHAAV
jgi:outer membrane PBP1 activator LpoA protein